MRLFATGILQLFILLLSSGAYAQSTESASSYQLENVIVESRIKSQSYLATEVMQYPTSVPLRPEFSSNYFLRAGLSLSKEADTYFANAELNATKSVTLNYQYISIAELYAGDSRKSEGFFFGRKKEFWNSADRDWNLGLWQPLFQEDGLRIEQQGLMGLFFKQNYDDFSLTVMASPMFIPTLNADLAEKNGTLVSESRWMRALPERSTVNGRDVSLRYHLKTPPYTQLLAKQSIALNLLYGDKEDSWYSVSIGRKPMNTPSIKYDAALVSRSVGFEGEADVVPVTHMHNIVGFDFGRKIDDTSFSASFTEDQPESLKIQNETSDSGFQTDYFQQQPKPLQALSLKAQKIIEIFSKPVRVAIGYLKIQSEKTPDVDSNGLKQSEFTPFRSLYTNALLLAGEFALDSYWTFQTKLLREFDQAGSIISFQANYKSEAQWSFFTGFDFLGVDQTSQIETDTRFLNSYRHNDRVYGGIAYAF